MSSLNVNALHVFEVVARHRNIRLASEELFISPSAVAQRIRRLEDELSCQLFIRHSRGVSLTDKGKQLQEDVSSALLLLHKAVNDIKREAGALTVSVPPTFANKWLIPKLPMFRKAFPSIELHIIATDDIANFKSDGVDIAVRQSSEPQDSSLDVNVLSQSDLVIVYSPNYVKSGTSLPQVWNFAGHSLIDDGHFNWKLLADSEPAFVTGSLLQVNQTGMAIDTALAGEGFCISSQLLIQDHIDSGALRVLRKLTIQPQMGFYLLSPKAKSENPNVSQFKTWLLSMITDG
ncbi:LysR substrate-binding domain-containing protein [Enterovibrio coralii]|uniref:HTH lysR-type domain-containing protein n=1 Tax=Enterovibrio coralii TaxID=294935 RepID=A0A135I697_9GAMM|nr:LysR substrate-binding domain-containing protein [Enterovibrio coralii]KXF80969.1 hypothetical protein ATN88_18145 [Enterovibrio coralii]